MGAVRANTTTTTTATATATATTTTTPTTKDTTTSTTTTLFSRLCCFGPGVGFALKTSGFGVLLF